MIVMAGPGVMASRQWISNAGLGQEAMVWRDDCAACAVVVLDGKGHEGRTYDITGPDLQDFAAMRSRPEWTGVPLAYVAVDDEAQYAMFDAMGIPRRPVDDHYVGAIPWNSDDMVTFGRAIREGFRDPQRPGRRAPAGSPGAIGARDDRGPRSDAARGSGAK